MLVLVVKVVFVKLSYRVAAIFTFKTAKDYIYMTGQALVTLLHGDCILEFYLLYFVFILQVKSQRMSYISKGRSKYSLGPIE